MTIGKETTFKELKKIVGSTKGMKKLPTEKALRESKEEIVFDGDVADAHFTIYRNGLFIYSRDGHGTVYAVDRCTEIEYPCTYDEEFGANATAGRTHRFSTDRQGRRCLIICVPEQEYMDKPWTMPLDVIGSHRLDHNQESREESHCDFSLDNDGGDWEQNACAPDFVDELEEKDEESELLKMLAEAQEGLTDCQKKAIQLRFFTKTGENMTQSEMAGQMGCSQPMARNHLEAALKKIRKNMGL